MDPFTRHLLVVCLAIVASGALPPSLARLTWLGYPCLCLLLMVGLSRRPRWLIGSGKPLFLAMGMASIVAQILWVFNPRSLLSTALPLLILYLVFIGWSLARLMRRLAEDSPDEGDLLAGGLAGYLLLGISGGLLLIVVDSLVPGCFRDTATGELVQLPPLGSTLAATSAWDLDVQRLNYFAFVSLTTVGYGDITPIHPLSQLASVSLSVAGPLYIAVVLGVLVSRLMARSPRS